MTGKQGKNSALIGKHNRDRILMALIESPMHFSALKKKLDLSAATLTGHLGSLLDEGYLKRQIEGRKIVYVVVEERKDPTVLEMRKDCWNELVLLALDYNSCLTQETLRKLEVTLNVLKDSIVHRKQDVDVPGIPGRLWGIAEDDLDKTYIGTLKIRLKSEGRETKKRGEK